MTAENPSATEPDYNTLFGLVERYSPSGAEREAVDWLVAWMERLGYEQAWRDEAGNAVGVRGRGERQIVLLGHIDTVAGKILPRRDGDRFFGRGAVDAKGPLAAFVDAAARVSPGPKWQIVVIGAVEEERDSLGARYVRDRYRPDFAVIGEPSRWDRVTLGYKGSAWAEITCRTPVAHSAGQAASASEQAVAVWETVRAWAQGFNQGRERAFEQLLPALRGLASGSDGFEEWARLQVGVRLPADLRPEEWYARLRELAHQAQVQPSGYAIPAYQAEKNTPLVRAFLAAIRAQGGKPGFVLKTGTADLNIVGPAWGCPAVAYGPGDSGLDHTPEEHILLSEYSRAVATLAEVLQRLGSEGDEPVVI